MIKDLNKSMRNSVKPNKALIKKRDELNGIIASRNLYLSGIRYINAQIIGDKIMVESLWAGTLVEYVDDGSFVNGWGHSVFLSKN